MAEFTKKLAALRRRMDVFRSRAFAPERAILERVGARLKRLTKIRIRIGWMGWLIAAFAGHLCLLPFLLHRDRGNFELPETYVVNLSPALWQRLQERKPEVPPPLAPRVEELVKEEPPSPAPGPPGPPTPASPPGPPPAVIGLGPGTPGGSGGGGTGSGGTGSGHAAALVRHGGSRETEEAVRRGLEWLGRHQSPDGRWDGDDFPHSCPEGGRCDGRGNPQYDVGVTALALAAFAAQGDEALPAWRPIAERALQFLLKTQELAGNFGKEEGSFMYNQAIAVYALALAYSHERNPDVGAAIQRGLGFSARAQQQGGGWDYTSASTGRNDLSITGWQLLAMDAARSAGFAFPAERIASAHSMVGRMVNPEAGIATYADSKLGAGENRPGLLPVAMLGLLLSGEPLASPRMSLLADRVLGLKPQARDRAQWKETGQSMYLWYYATLALFHRGGRWWDDWNPAMKDALLALQRTDGHAAGSWDPDPNWIGQVGGRVYATAIAVLTLEVYYRITPKFLETP